MQLQIDPCLAEVPGFSPEQLDALTRSVELKKQKLEDDIKQYIVRKQEELRNYERELLAEYRSMESPPPRVANDRALNHIQASTAPANLPSNSPAAPPRSTDPTPSTDSTTPGPDEKAKRTKHTRVHKREKELFGLITPIFLPLLEAGDPTPVKKKLEKKKEKVDVVGPSSPNSEQASSPTRDAEKGKEKRRSRSRPNEEKMERDDDTAAVAGETLKDSQKAESERKKKRSPIKKSSLRLNNTPRARRKRVSLVIDDQIVLPADSIIEPPLTSPSETTISTASNSTASLDELIDPQLISPQHNTSIHQDPVHHSLPLNTSLPSTSPTKHTGHTLSESPPPLEYEPPQTATRTLLDPSLSQHTDINIPQQTPSSQPIYASRTEAAEVEDEEFSTYVGGLSGSGVDNVDQAGSYGYPSSLGASYLESYMQSRPLSVRLAAAERAELAENEKKKLLQGEEARGGEDSEVRVSKSENRNGNGNGSRHHGNADDDMDVMGEMEGF